MANTPYLFFSDPQPEGDCLLAPEVSSERREYVYRFGVLTSSAHMAWMRVVAGRLKSDYRYSAAMVYNNFPWPTLGKCGMTCGTGAARGTGGDGTIETTVPPVATPVSPESPVPPVISNISQTAQAILDVRGKYPDSSLADLYDPLTMPPAPPRAAKNGTRACILASTPPRMLPSLRPGRAK